MYNKKFIILPVTVIFLLVVFSVVKNAQATTPNFASGFTVSGGDATLNRAVFSGYGLSGNSGNAIYTLNASGNANLVIQGLNWTHAVHFKDSYGPSEYATLSGGYASVGNLVLTGFNSSGAQTSQSTYSSNGATVNGTLTATQFSGGGAGLTGVVANTYNGTVSSGNVSSGSFGSLTGGGIYTFPSAYTSQGGTQVYAMPWFNAGGAPVGYIKLVTPIVDTESNMFTIKITGYNYGSTYGSGSIVNITCGGYAYSGNPSGSGLVSAQCASSFGSNIPVEIGEENRGGTYYVVIRLGTPTSSWYYNHFTAEYIGWQAKSPNGFSWVTGETTPAQSGNNHNVIIDDRGGTITTSGAVNFANALKVNSSGITSWGGSDQGIMTWDTGYASIYASSGNVLRLGANGAQSTITINNGNVGIGTTNPGLLLDVRGDIGNGINLGSHNVGNQGTTGFVRGNAVAGEQAGMYITTEPLNGGNGGYISFKTWGMNISGTREVLRINESGNVGIGTTASGQKLQVAGGNIGLSGTNSFYFSDYGGGWYMQDGTWLRSTNGTSIWLGGGNFGSNGGLTLGYGGATPPTGGIITTGAVGVGIQSPAFKLDVSGTGAFRSGDNSYVYYGPNGTWGGSLYTGATTNKSGASTAQVISTNGNLHLDAGSSNDMYLNYYSNGRPIHIFGPVDMNSSLTVGGQNVCLANGTNCGSISIPWGNVSGKPNIPADQEGNRYSTDFNSILSTGFYNGEGTPSNSPVSYGQVIMARGIDTGLQIAGGYSNDNLYFRGYGYGPNGGFYPWRTVIHSGNIGSQSVNYATSAGTATNAGNADTVDTLHASSFRQFDTWQYNHYSGSDGNEYATVYRDSNDGGYFMDPASVSNVYQIRTNGMVSDWGDIRTGSINSSNVYAYRSICANNNSGSCDSANGVVIGLNNTSAATNFPSSGSAFVNSGNFGVGTSGPSAHLHVEGGKMIITSTDSGWGQIQLGNPSAGEASMAFVSGASGMGTGNPSYSASKYVVGISPFGVGNQTFGITNANLGGGGGIYMTWGGNVGIGTYGPGYTLDVAGTIHASGAIYGDSFQYSDETLKKNITTIDNPIDKIMQLRGVTFNWKKDDKDGVGVIAQDVEKVYPELVTTTSDGTKAVQYSNLVAPLIEAVKAQQKEILDLKANDNKQSIILSKLCKDQLAKKTSSWKTICADYLAK